MVEQIAQALLRQASWGLYMRVIVCGVLTYLDLSSDILVTKQYFESGEVTGATLTICFLVMNLALQIILVVAQNFRNQKVMWQEIFYTLILLKPALDVIRLLQGATQLPHQTFALIQENSYSKAMEVAAESLPAAITQLFFLLRTNNPTALQLASIAVSITTTAVTIASTDYNLNMDPRTRATDHGVPVRYFGLIPDGNIAEFSMFVAMVCCTGTQMAVACLGTALLTDFDPIIATGAWAVRFVVMYAIKLLRRDLNYYPPIRGIAGFLVAACAARPVALLLADFTFFI
jgi:hypothetical protein